MTTRAHAPVAPAVPTVSAPAPPPATEPDASYDASSSTDGEKFRRPIALPKCGTEDAALLRQSLKSLDERLRASEAIRSTNGVRNGATSIEDEISMAWVHPCLTHIARIFPRPHGSDAKVRELWLHGLGGSLLSSVGSLYRRDGHDFLVVPPENARPLSAEERRAIAPWRCADGSVDCGHAASYIARAEVIFRREERLAHSTYASLLDEYIKGDPMSGENRATALHPCMQRSRASTADAPSTQTPFEVFSICAAGEAPRTWRYPEDIRLRARDRGWLVLRGRRGHYAFADEVRAYDLATGAAYVARSESGLVLAGPNVDFGAVDAKRKPEVFTGTVAREQVRELAFILGTRRAVQLERSQAQLVPIAPDLPITLTPGRGASTPFDVPLSWSFSSADTSIAYEVSGEGGAATIVTQGTFIWPSSSNPVENYADDLVRILEAGLERGCAPAALPSGITHGRHGAVHPIDADPNAQRDVFSDLSRALEGLGQKSLCATAKR